MSISKEKKQSLIKEFAVVANDTGSAEVQCAVLTERIKSLTGHLNDNKQDTQAKRGMIALVIKRRKLLRYVESKDINRYKQLVERLGIRK
jgi:small subunit ribosomal protein S15